MLRRPVPMVDSDSRGECVLLIDGEERRLRAWDFAHFPPGTEHILVGAGEGPCVFLAVGAAGRAAGSSIRSPTWPCGTTPALRERTTSAREAYADAPKTEAGPYQAGLLGDS